MYFYNKPLYSSTYLQTPAVSVYVKSFYCERHVQEAPLHWAGRVSRIDRTLVMLFIISSFSRFPSTGAARLTGCVTRTLPPAGRSCRLPRTTSAVRQLQTPAVVRLTVYFGKCACLLSHWEPSQDFRCQQKTSFTHSGTKVDRFHTRSLYKVKRSDTKVTPPYTDLLLRQSNTAQ